MSEPFATFLMPIYALLSWLGLIFYGQTGRYILPVAVVGWIWAAINVARTKRLDLGIVTFFFVIVAALCERKFGFTNGVKLGLSVSSILVAGNYSLVLFFWKQIRKDLAKAKSQLWLSIFWWYCLSGTIFWLVAIVRTWMRGTKLNTK
ncbi:hypothetical protein ACHAXT_008897 [Thalassiosira profunda]